MNNIYCGNRFQYSQNLSFVHPILHRPRFLYALLILVIMSQLARTSPSPIGGLGMNAIFKCPLLHEYRLTNAQQCCILQGSFYVEMWRPFVEAEVQLGTSMLNWIGEPLNVRLSTTKFHFSTILICFFINLFIYFQYATAPVNISRWVRDKQEHGTLAHIRKPAQPTVKLRLRRRSKYYCRCLCSKSKKYTQLNLYKT